MTFFYGALDVREFASPPCIIVFSCLSLFTFRCLACNFVLTVILLSGVSPTASSEWVEFFPLLDLFHSKGSGGPRLLRHLADREYLLLLLCLDLL